MSIPDRKSIGKANIEKGLLPTFPQQENALNEVFLNERPIRIGLFSAQLRKKTSNLINVLIDRFDNATERERIKSKYSKRLP